MAKVKTQGKEEKTQVKVSVKIKNLIKKVAEIQAQEKKLSDMKKDLKAEIREYMKDNSLEEIVANLYRAIYCEFDSETFDTDLFKAERPKLYEKYLKTVHKTRFEVKEAKATK